MLPLNVIKRELQARFKNPVCKYKCQTCSMSFATSKKLKYHRGYHFPVEERTCNLCTKEFLNYHIYKEHVRTLHPKDEQQHVCDLCDKKYSTKKSLDTHKANIHSNKKDSKPTRTYNFICEKCGVLFTNIKLLEAHTLKKHSDHDDESISPAERAALRAAKKLLKPVVKEELNVSEWKYKCPTCSEAFPNDKKLKYHTGYHLSVEKRTCRFCSKEFANFYNLKEHLRNVHPVVVKTFMCHDCGKNFKTRKIMEAHKANIHSGLRFSCPQCSKEFGLEKALDRHFQKVHLMQKQVPCSECDKLFKGKYDLERHMKTKHGISGVRGTDAERFSVIYSTVITGTTDSS